MPSKSRNTGNLVSDNNLFVNPITDNTGIGTENPVQKFQVGSGTSVVVIDNVGKLGIGTTNPQVPLDVVGNGRFTGVVTASSFVGNLTGTATTATNLSDAANITTGTINSSRLSGSYNINVSYANTAGISTVAQGLTGTPSISVASINASGISTLGTVQISSGIITATSGVVTYYGDGSKLSGVVGTQVVTQSAVSTPVYPTFANAVGVSSIGISTTQFVFIPSTGNVGLGTTNPGATLQVNPTSTSIAGLFSGSTSNDMVRITQTGSGNALLVEDSANPDTTPFVVDASGRVGIGVLAPESTLHVIGSAAIFSVGGKAGSNTYLQLRTTDGATAMELQFTQSTNQYWTIQSVENGVSYRNLSLNAVGGNVGVRTVTPTQELHVQGNTRITGAIYDSTNSPGTSGQVLQSTVTGTQWATASAAGGSGKFDTSIDNVLFVQPTGTLDIVGVGTTTSQITTFPIGSNEYIVHSIHVTNVSNGDAEVTAGFVMNGKRVPASITVGGGPGIHTITVGSASSIVVGMAVTGTGNIGETVGVGTTAGLQYNTYVTSVDSNIITLSKPLSGTISGTAVFSPVSKIVSRLPVPVGSAVELLKQPFILNASDSIVIQSTGAGSGIGSTSTAAISQTSGSNFLTVTAGAAITSFIAAGQLINGTGSNTGIQTNTYVGVGYTPGSLSIPMTRPATSTLASQILSFTETVVPQDGALQATIVYQSTTDLTYNSGVGLAGTVSTAIYGTGASNSATVQSVRVANVSDSGDYPVWVAIGNTDTIFSYLAYNMIIPKNSNIELCEAPKRLGIGQSIFAFSDTANVIEVQVAGKLKA